MSCMVLCHKDYIICKFQGFHSDDVDTISFNIIFNIY
jgi:hypothetical protein